MTPHVLIFPLPFHGPVNCMLKLAEILTLNGVKVTFLNTQHVQRRLTFQFYFFAKYPGLRFETVPDGLPEENPRTADQILNLLESMEAVSQPLLRQILGSGSPPVTCLIADGVFTFAVSVAREVGVPLLYFDTISPCGLWSLLCLPALIQAEELPFGGKRNGCFLCRWFGKDEELDKIIANVPGMEEAMMRRRDLPSFFRIKDINHPSIQLVLKEANHIPLAQGLIFNTFQHLEPSILSQMRTICPNTYAVGPLHAHLRTRLAAEAGQEPPPSASISIWEEDGSCVSWLDRQPSNSVVYVSIGSLAVMTRRQLYEVWHGLVNSGSRFLWVRRPGSVSEPGEKIPSGLLRATEERGCLVRWAPQEEVLAHPSIGGFLTHCGWNSTLESIVAGIPMICWPRIAEQHVNSRYVGEVWKLGVDMKDRCDRVVVEKMIREVMELRKDEFLGRAQEMARLAGSSVGPGGSSYVDMGRLIEDIKMIKIPVNHN